MGTTSYGVHVYSSDYIENCECFSIGWQTYLPQDKNLECTAYIKCAKALSNKNKGVPVLWFGIFDSDQIYLSFFLNGKKVVDYSDISGGKKIFSVPGMIGYPDGYKRRLSTILECGDAELKTDMLEEYFGVCLIPEIYEYAPEKLRRKREEALYRTYIEEERKIKGKNAPIKAELINVYKGKIFNHYFGDVFNSYDYAPHCYLYGFSDPSSTMSELQPMKFVGDCLDPIGIEEFAKPSSRAIGNHNTMITGSSKLFAYEAGKLSFGEKAPDEFKGRKMALPRGYFPLCFDKNNRLILTKNYNGMAIADSSLKIIAKINLKGCVVDYVNGYILTEGSQSNFAFCYDPGQEVRIYRLYEEEEYGKTI